MRVVAVARGREGRVHWQLGAWADLAPGDPLAASYVLTAVELNSAASKGWFGRPLSGTRPRACGPRPRSASGRRAGDRPVSARLHDQGGAAEARSHRAMPGAIRTAASSAGGTVDFRP